MNATCKALRRKLQRYTKESNGSSNVLLTVLPVAVVVMGATAYTILNCCNQEWCYSVGFMSDLLKCAQ